MVPLTLFQCWYALSGPRLHRIRDLNGYGLPYVPNNLEKTGDFFIKWMVTMYNVAYGISPFLMWMLYRRNMLSQEGFLTMFKYGISASILLTFSSTLRAVGRLANSDYKRFTTSLYRARQGQVVDIRRYDFDFWAWPVDFYWNEGPRGDPRTDVPLKRIFPAEPEGGRTFIGKIIGAPWSFMCYAMANTVGYRLLYPGTLGFIQTALHNALLQGRAKLVEERGGRRAKIRTRDGNDIDTMFVDRRNRSTHASAGGNPADGQFLVICSEGNAGFYEVGCMSTPIESDYSVLGWNHPGFAGSNGTPFPDQEQHAIDAVLQYATYRLGFPEEKIILFAWSIGGYTTSFAAMNFPRARAVILDATFDHVLPLALKQMPDAIGSLIQDTVVNHANLNNAEMMQRYQGPFALIRRTKDEMISTVGPPNRIKVWSNRGNDLLMSLLTNRYPMIFTEETRDFVLNFLALESETERDSAMADSGLEEEVCEAKFQSFVSALDSEQPIFPLTLEPSSPEEARHLALFLVTKHMRHFNSSHCTPLPLRFFDMPWSPDKRV